MELAVGQKLSVGEVRALLAGKPFRRCGIDDKFKDSIPCAESNARLRDLIDELIPDDFEGTLNFNRVVEEIKYDSRTGNKYSSKGKYSVIMSDTPYAVFSEKLESKGDGTFTYLGKSILY